MRRIGWVSHDGHPRQVWCDLLEQLQPFSAHCVFEQHEAGRVASRPREALDEAGADRIAGERKYDGDGVGRLQQ